MRRLGNVQIFKTYMFSLARLVTPPWDVYMTNCHPGWQGYPTWQTGQPTLAGYPTYHVNVVKIKWEIIWKGRLPHLGRLPHPPLCKQALNSKTSLVTPIPTCITRLQSVYQNITFLQISKNLYLQFTNTFIFFFFMAPLSQLLLSTKTSFVHRHETCNTTNIIFFNIDFTHCSNIT